MEESWVGNDPGGQRNSERYAKASKILRNSVVLLQTPDASGSTHLLIRTLCSGSNVKNSYQKCHWSHLNKWRPETAEVTDVRDLGMAHVRSPERWKISLSTCRHEMTCKIDGDSKVKAMEKDAAVGKRFLVSSETGYTQVSWRNEIWVQIACFHTGSRHCGRELLQVWCLQRYSLVASHHYHLVLPARCRWQRWSQTDIRCAECTVKNWVVVVTSMNSFSCVLFKLWTMNPNSGWLKCRQAEACNFLRGLPFAHRESGRENWIQVIPSERFIIFKS